ncbi:MAG: 3-dehydroquinate synthase, partial [Panacagrimonas sp.]
MSIRILNVELGQRSYPIRIGQGLLRDPASYAFLRGRRAMLLTDEHVAEHHLDGALSALKLERDQALILPP